MNKLSIDRDLDRESKNINHSIRILVVDDEHDLRLIYSELLEDAGYNVSIAPDGAIAWDLLQQYDYDLLITDNHMPELSGIELIEKLNNNQHLLPVIIVSGTSPAEDLRQFPWSNVVSKLFRPHTPRELLGSVKNALRPGAKYSSRSLNYEFFPGVGR